MRARTLLLPVVSRLSFLSALACSPAPGAEDPELARQLAHAENVTIFHDDFGVPHVYGKTDADAVFGLLYAQSEVVADDLPRR